MTQFVEIPASEQSIRQKKAVFGIGINDANYLTKININNKIIVCPYYQKWKNILLRCYSPKTHEKFPTYKECFVCDEWLTFSNFKSWMEKQDWQGKHLDKDLLVQGNKEYSPSKCLFVTPQINTLLTSRTGGRGEFMLGVYFYKPHGKFRAKCRCINGGLLHLGYFCSETEAHKAYKKYKYALIAKIAKEQEEPLKSALLRYKIPEY